MSGEEEWVVISLEAESDNAYPYVTIESNKGKRAGFPIYNSYYKEVEQLMLNDRRFKLSEIKGFPRKEELVNKLGDIETFKLVCNKCGNDDATIESNHGGEYTARCHDCGNKENSINL